MVSGAVEMIGKQAETYLNLPANDSLTVLHEGGQEDFIVGGDGSKIRAVLQWFAGGFIFKTNVPGRQLVIAQCFTKALQVENENGFGKLNGQFRWHTQT